MRLRLSVLEAYVLAAERREEVIEAVAEAADPREARRSVAQLLGITEDDASSVLDLRVRHFSRARSHSTGTKPKSSRAFWSEDADPLRGSGAPALGNAA